MGTSSVQLDGASSVINLSRTCVHLGNRHGKLNLLSASLVRRIPTSTKTRQRLDPVNRKGKDWPKLHYVAFNMPRGGDEGQMVETAKHWPDYGPAFDLSALLLFIGVDLADLAY